MEYKFDLENKTIGYIEVKELGKSLNLNIVAANTIGADSINEYFAADSLSTPINLAVVIVTPDLDTPGINARACETPIKKVCLNVICSYLTLFFAFLSTTYNKIPITIKAKAMIIGLLNVSSKK